MESVTLKIDYPATAKGKSTFSKRYGTNAYYSGKPWYTRKQDADYWHMLTKAAITEAIGYDPRFFANPVEVFFYWNDKLDLDNHSIMGKMIVDGLKGRLIADDSRKYLAGVHHLWHNENYIKIVIKEA